MCAQQQKRFCWRCSLWSPVHLMAYLTTHLVCMGPQRVHKVIILPWNPFLQHCRIHPGYYQLAVWAILCILRLKHVVSSLAKWNNASSISQCTISSIQCLCVVGFMYIWERTCTSLYPGPAVDLRTHISELFSTWCLLYLCSSKYLQPNSHSYRILVTPLECICNQTLHLKFDSSMFVPTGCTHN